MKNKRLSIFLILALVFVLSACSRPPISEPDETDGKMKLAATIFPLYDLVRVVGGERAETVLILEPGASPHTFEATPGKIKDLQGTEIIFAIGGGLDDWTENIANAVSGAKTLRLEDYVLLQYFENGHEDKHDGEDHENAEGHEEDEHEEDGHEHGDFDPHYWLSPEAAEAMLAGIALTLGEIDPQNREYYAQRAEAHKQKIREKVPEWREKINTLDTNKIMVFHDAWNYFAVYFDLEIVASFEPFPGKTPTPAYLAGLLKEIETHKIKTLFVEPQLSQAAMETFANDLKMNIGVLDPLGGVPGRETYLDLIDYNVNTVYEFLSKNENGE